MSAAFFVNDFLVDRREILRSRAIRVSPRLTNRGRAARRRERHARRAIARKACVHQLSRAIDEFARARK